MERRNKTDLAANIANSFSIHRLTLLAMCITLTACGGGGGGGRSGPLPSSSLGSHNGGNAGEINMNGQWTLTSTTGENDCGDPRVAESADFTVIQNGNTVEFKRNDGKQEFNGTLSNNVLTANISFDEEGQDGQLLAFSSTLTLTVDSQDLTGESTYTYQTKTGDASCSGKESFTGHKKSNSTTPPTTPPTTPNPPPKDSGTPSDKEPNNDPTSASPLPLNSSVKGSVNKDSDKFDFYAFKLSKNGNYQIDLSDFGQNDLDVYLLDGSGTIITKSVNDPGLPENIGFDIEDTKNGTMYIVVSGFDTNSSTSQYTLKLSVQ